MKKKNKVLLIIFVIAFTILAGAAVLFLSDAPAIGKPEEKAKEAKKALVDGDMSNVEETLSAQHIYNNYFQIFVR